ncbi:2-polyprenyl-6-methoxyphenol hydroxylase-like FAD-dependent oxidoreductase [Duganella sp. 1224]|uniref:FAD-dependent monooxygenase n=1 Tax=Duganella sp. 1224 TaxID=2587052 RepID=UPI0015CEE2B8|nr:FAD-dependent monooxygenase [Duganella sp. 1224]NYE61527.1 2-polyprenyl-6-methoxyphenol hydroxylase-like FAD-dependent oxidoreductase [Duganella sp. 1224]
MKTYDIIISGAGPVGLFLAGELALGGCAVLVLEQAARPDAPLKRLPFGLRGLNAPSIEALDRRGLLEQLEVPQRHPAGHVGAGQGGHFAGIPFLQSDIDTAQWPRRLPTSTPFTLPVEVAQLEALLTRRAQSLGVAIRRGAGVIGAGQDAAGVTVHAGAAAFRARWLVGCDGARSVVRKAGGFDFAGTEPAFTGYTLHAELAGAEPLGVGRHVTPRGMYLQSQPGYLVLQDFDGGAFHQRGEAVTREHAQAVLRHISGLDVTITALHVASTWTDRARQATHYRNGRILLAGDAAHIHSPLGGQGLNLGLGDAMNLGWKLAATARGDAPDGLLDSYEAERHPLGERVLDWSRAQVAIMRPGPEARALHAIFRDLIGTRDGATYVASRVWGIHASSVPNVVIDGVTVNQMLRDGHGMLLDFDADPARRDWARRHGIRYVSGAVAERLGYHALLVRPDGVIAWYDGDGNDDLSRAAAPWFGATAQGSSGSAGSMRSDLADGRKVSSVGDSRAPTLPGK